MNYTELQAKIAAEIGRNDLGDNIKDMIYYVETELSTLLRISLLESYSVLEFVEPGKYLLPDDAMEIQRVVVANKDVQQDRPAASNKYRSGGRSYYTHGDHLYLNGSVDELVDVELYYYRKVPHLTEENPSNALLEKHPSLYVYGATSGLHSLVQDLELAGAYNSRYVSIIDLLNTQAARRRGSPRLTTNYNIGQHYTGAA